MLDQQPAKRKFTELVTKKDRTLFIKTKLAEDDRWMLKGLLAIYGCQTNAEKFSSKRETNGVGFTGIDADLLSVFARRAMYYGAEAAISNKDVAVDATKFLSLPCVSILRNKMPKYAGQLSRMADSKTPIIKKVKA